MGRTLVVNLPGKPGSIRCCLDAVPPAPASSSSARRALSGGPQVFPAIPYCIDLLGGAYLEGNPDKARPLPRPRPPPSAACGRAGTGLGADAGAGGAQVAVFRPPAKKS